MSKKEIRTKTSLISALLLIAAVAIGGCSAHTIYLYPDKYTPRFSPDLGIYNNRAIVLKDVINETANTSRRYFSAPDNSVNYYVPKHYLGPYGSAPDMGMFFRQVIAKAFDELGIMVPEEKEAGEKVPAIEFTLLSLSDEKFHFQCTLYLKERPVFSKKYIVTNPRLGETGKNSVNELENRAYKMIDSSIGAVLGDLEFKKVYSKVTFRP